MAPDEGVAVDMASEVGWLSQVTGRLVPMVAILQRGVLYLLPDERCVHAPR